jgi:hypothetical protein
MLEPSFCYDSRMQHSINRALLWVFGPAVLLSTLTWPLYTALVEQFAPQYNHYLFGPLLYIGLLLFFLLTFYFGQLYFKHVDTPHFWRPTKRKLILAFSIGMLTPLGNLVGIPIPLIFTAISFLIIYPLHTIGIYLQGDPIGATILWWGAEWFIKTFLIAVVVLAAAYFMACILSAAKQNIASRWVHVFLYLLGIYVFTFLLFGFSYI